MMRILLDAAAAGDACLLRAAQGPAGRAGLISAAPPSSGASLIMVIASLVIMGLVGAGVLMLVSTGSMEGIQALNQNQAFLAAESGVSKAKACFATNAGPSTNTGTVGPAAFVAIVGADGVITSIGSKDDAQWTSIWAPAVAADANAIVVYGTRTNAGTPRYRLWLGTNWSGPSNALSVGSKNLNWVVAKGCPARDEYIVATIDTGRVVKAQVFNNGSWGHLQTLSTNMANADYRGVDVAYASQSGNAMVVAGNNTPDPVYWVWNGSAWNGPGTVNFSGAQAVNWITLAADPASDEMIVMVQAADRRFAAMVWNGSNAWGHELLCTGLSVNLVYEAMSLEYETSGHQAVLVNNSGVKNLGRFNWAAWNGTAWSAQSTNNALGDYVRFMSLANDPNSDNMLLTYLDNDSDIGKVFWNGSGWTAFYELETSCNAAGDRCVQGVFESISTNAGHALVVYSDVNTGRSRHSVNPAGSTWDAEIAISSIKDSTTLQVRRTADGKVLVIYFDDDAIQYDFSWYDGTNWAAMQTLETEPSVLASPFKEPFMMAPQLYFAP